MTKLFISLSEPSYARHSLMTAAARIGVEVVGHIDGPHVLALSNQTSQALSRVAGVNFIGVSTFDILSDCRDRIAHMPALSAVQSEADVLAMNFPVFVKPRKNLRKGTTPLAYTRWASGAALHAAKWQEFSTAEVELGGLVALPDMGNPMSCLEITFAANADSEVFLMHASTHGFAEHNRPTNLVSGATAPADLMSAIQSFCTTQQIRGGIFNVQAVEHGGAWKVMDWNTRPDGTYGVAAGAHPGMADAGLAHMLGLPVVKTPVHFELRSYWSNMIPNHRADEVRSYGLIPSWVWHRDAIGRVYGIGDTKEEVQAKFAAFEGAML
jgi:hypothetical protein